MDARIFNSHFLRQPQWRAERVWRMLEHRPSPLRPRRYDDHYVRAYRRFLMSFLAAGGVEPLIAKVVANQPHVHAAHMLHYDPDSERRQILEAWLLTTEPYFEIAERFAMDEKTVDVYEQVFFNVRDRLECTDWIAKVIIGPRDYLASNSRGVMTQDQRGFLYKLFGYNGGPLVLEALVSGIGPADMPQRAAGVADWLDESLLQLVRTRATAASAILEVNGGNVMRLLKTAMRPKATAGAAQGVAQGPLTFGDEYIKKVAETLDFGVAQPSRPTLGGTGGASPARSGAARESTGATKEKPSDLGSIKRRLDRQTSR